MTNLSEYHKNKSSYNYLNKYINGQMAGGKDTWDSIKCKRLRKKRYYTNMIDVINKIPTDRIANKQDIENLTKKDIEHLTEYVMIQYPQESEPFYKLCPESYDENPNPFKCMEDFEQQCADSFPNNSLYCVLVTRRIK